MERETRVRPGSTLALILALTIPVAAGGQPSPEVPSRSEPVASTEGGRHVDQFELINDLDVPVTVDWLDTAAKKRVLSLGFPGSNQWLEKGQRWRLDYTTLDSYWHAVRTRSGFLCSFQPRQGAVVRLSSLAACRVVPSRSEPVASSGAEGPVTDFTLTNDRDLAITVKWLDGTAEGHPSFGGDVTRARPWIGKGQEWRVGGGGQTAESHWFAIHSENGFLCSFSPRQDARVRLSDLSACTAAVTAASPRPPGCAGGEARFVDQGDGTVMDCNTGKMWLRDARCLGAEAWKDAFLKVHRLNSGEDLGCRGYRAGTHTDWRLPEMADLCGGWDGSCYGNTCCDPSRGMVTGLESSEPHPELVTINDWRWEEHGSVFVGVQIDAYWSATTGGDWADVLRRTDWDRGESDALFTMVTTGPSDDGSERNGYNVWAVRGGSVEPRFPWETIAGTIVDSWGEPVAGVSVELRPWSDEPQGNAATLQSVLTGDDGNFRFDGVPSGDYDVFVQAHTMSILRQVKTDLPVRNMKVTVPANGRVEGTVVDFWEMPPRRGYSIEVGFSGMPRTREAQIGEDGKFRLKRLEPGRYSSRILPPAPGGGAQPGPDFEVFGGRTTEISHTLAATGGRVRGVVQDGWQLPIPGASVRLSDGSSYLTKANGLFDYRDVAPGTYTIHATPSGGEPFKDGTAGGVSVVKGETVWVPVRLAPGCPRDIQNECNRACAGDDPRYEDLCYDCWDRCDGPWPSPRLRRVPRHETTSTEKGRAPETVVTPWSTVFVRTGNYCRQFPDDKQGAMGQWPGGTACCCEGGEDTPRMVKEGEGWSTRVICECPDRSATEPGGHSWGGLSKEWVQTGSYCDYNVPEEKWGYSAGPGGGIKCCCHGGRDAPTVVQLKRGSSVTTECYCQKPPPEVGRPCIEGPGTCGDCDKKSWWASRSASVAAELGEDAVYWYCCPECKDEPIIQKIEFMTGMRPHLCSCPAG